MQESVPEGEQIIHQGAMNKSKIAADLKNDLGVEMVLLLTQQILGSLDAFVTPSGNRAKAGSKI